MEITTLIIMAILVEAIWENLKMIWENGKFSINRIGALILAILLCVLARVDLFILCGITFTIPFVAYICTGIIVSRGANFVSDLFEKIRGN